ncbi:hypothetical protein ACWCSD_45380, partial [Nonomuraea sp. NPDC001684]
MDQNDPGEPRLRPAEPDDHGRIVAVLDDWWGRPISAGLPRLFLRDPTLTAPHLREPTLTAPHLREPTLTAPHL